jgi:hypothetical protein
MKIKGYVNTTLFVAGSVASFFQSTGAKADEFTERMNTVYMFGDYGLGTYKSLLVDSNDTMGVVTYGLGVTAGQEKNISVEYRTEKQTVNFKINQSSLTSAWTSTIFKYRIWAFEFGPVIGGVKMKSERESSEIFNIVGDGYGGYFGILIPVSRSDMAYLNVMSVSTAPPVDTKERTVTLGPRLDIELGGKIALTRKALNFTVGYRQRTHSITEGGIAYNELQTATFLGLQLGKDF